MSDEEKFAPIRLVEVDIARPLPALLRREESSGKSYDRALSLVRLGRHPIGLVELEIDWAGLSSEIYAQRIWDVLGPSINARLRGQGSAEVAGLGSDGLTPVDPETLATAPLDATNLPFVSVIVATRDRAHSLSTCIDSLLALAYPNFEVVIVDNAPSSSATADLIKMRYGGHPQVRYLREDRPGLAIAHNCALQGVDAPIVAITDDDVTVDRHWLTALVEEFVASDRIGCVTGMILPAELETRAQALCEQFGGFGKGFERRVFDLNEHVPADSLFPYAAGAFGSGANMAFRTAALRAVGGFDPALGTGTRAMGGDDLAAFFDIIASGYQLVYQPAALLWHQHRRDYQGFCRQIYGYGVGLTAYLTKVVLDRPGRALDLAFRAPRGMRHLLMPGSAKNRKKEGDYPKELSGLELKGMAYGPLAYLRSRWHTRHVRRRLITMRAAPSIPRLDGAPQR